MKKKKNILIGLACVISLAGLFYYVANDKKAYDYSDYYEDIEVKPTNAPSTTEEEIVEIKKELSLEKLQTANSDVVGIIRFGEDIIYEPIVQAPDNKYYERRNFDKSYSAAGIPFISYDGNIDSKNVVIYGHSSKKSNIIFTPLMDYLSYDYYKNNDTFQFILNNEERTYQIFAVLTYDTNDLNDSFEFAQSSWRKETDFSKFVTSLKASSEYMTGVEVTDSDKLMTLVTCDTRDNSKRVVVIAKLLSEESLWIKH